MLFQLVRNSMQPFIQFIYWTLSFDDKEIFSKLAFKIFDSLHWQAVQILTLRLKFFLYLKFKYNFLNKSKWKSNQILNTN